MKGNVNVRSDQLAKRGSNYRAQFKVTRLVISILLILGLALT